MKNKIFLFLLVLVSSLLIGCDPNTLSEPTNLIITFEDALDSRNEKLIDEIKIDEIKVSFYNEDNIEIKPIKKDNNVFNFNAIKNERFRVEFESKNDIFISKTEHLVMSDSDQNNVKIEVMPRLLRAKLIYKDTGDGLDVGTEISLEKTDSGKSITNKVQEESKIEFKYISAGQYRMQNEDLDINIGDLFIDSSVNNLNYVEKYIDSPFVEFEVNLYYNPKYDTDAPYKVSLPIDIQEETNDKIETIIREVKTNEEGKVKISSNALRLNTNYRIVPSDNHRTLFPIDKNSKEIKFEKITDNEFNMEIKLEEKEVLGEIYFIEDDKFLTESQFADHDPEIYFEADYPNNIFHDGDSYVDKFKYRPEIKIESSDGKRKGILENLKLPILGDYKIERENQTYNLLRRSIELESRSADEFNITPIILKPQDAKVDVKLTNTAEYFSGSVIMRVFNDENEISERTITDLNVKEVEVRDLDVIFGENKFEVIYDNTEITDVNDSINIDLEKISNFIKNDVKPTQEILTDHEKSEDEEETTVKIEFENENDKTIQILTDKNTSISGGDGRFVEFNSDRNFDVSFWEEGGFSYNVYKKGYILENAYKKLDNTTNDIISIDIDNYKLDKFDIGDAKEGDVVDISLDETLGYTNSNEIETNLNVELGVNRNLKKISYLITDDDSDDNRQIFNGADEVDIEEIDVGGQEYNGTISFEKISDGFHHKLLIKIEYKNTDGDDIDLITPFGPYYFE